ncbi:hypothetical protein, partial [Staphylococcus pasteuri_A]
IYGEFLFRDFNVRIVNYLEPYDYFTLFLKAPINNITTSCINLIILILFAKILDVLIETDLELSKNKTEQLLKRLEGGVTEFYKDRGFPVELLMVMSILLMIATLLDLH